MNSSPQYLHRHPLAGRWQAGGLTIFNGIFVLLLMTVFLLYATRVEITEQRISSNEVRQKLAFHAAESAVDQGLEYVIANSGRVFKDSATAAHDGSGGFRAGWFANDGTTPGWAPCTVALVALDDHPCGGDIAAGTGSFFYDDPTTTAGTATGADSLPINTAILPANSTANVSMLLCILDRTNITAGCQPAPADKSEERTAIAVVQLMGYGYSDCTDVTDVTTCSGEARVSRPLSNYKDLSGSPAVPLTTKATFPPSGTAEVVAHYNAGGIGVPISVWSNNNTACSAGAAVVGSGSWATCEMQEWYGQDATPPGVACAVQPCSCSQSEALSYSSGQNITLGPDIVSDDNFPCDIFEFYFNVPRNMYDVVKGAATVISDCSSLDATSTGLYWVSGSQCQINSNTTIGSPENPIILISAATSTTLAGGAKFFGVLYVFDGEDPAAELSTAGNTAIYGAVMVDANMGNYTGTFQIVYSETILANASGLNGVGTVGGGWRDFGLPAWQ